MSAVESLPGLSFHLNIIMHFGHSGPLSGIYNDLRELLLCCTVCPDILVLFFCFPQGCGSSQPPMSIIQVTEITEIPAMKHISVGGGGIAITQ
jgi:hypothetical protein